MPDACAADSTINIPPPLVGGGRAGPPLLLYGKKAVLSLMVVTLTAPQSDTSSTQHNCIDSATAVAPCLPARLLSPCTEWYWKVLLRHWVYRACAVILFLFSLIIVWSEATFGIPNVRLSIIAQIIYLGHNNTNYIIIEVRCAPYPHTNSEHFEVSTLKDFLPLHTCWVVHGLWPWAPI